MQGRCDIHALSTIVVANLQSGPWTLAIIQKLAARSIPFRDAVLELEPLLLDHLLNKSAGSEEAYDKVGMVVPLSAMLTRISMHPYVLLYYLAH